MRFGTTRSQIYDAQKSARAKWDATQDEWDDEIARDVAPGADTPPLPVGTELADPARAYHRGQLRVALAAAIVVCAVLPFADRRGIER